MPGQKPTFKVRGIVVVDGAVPAPNVSVICHPSGEKTKPGENLPSAKTDSEGKFEFLTYKAADGVPAGNYVITFSQRKYDLQKHKYTGPDLLKDRYHDPAKSKFEFKVENKSLDLGKFELTTK